MRFGGSVGNSFGTHGVSEKVITYAYLETTNYCNLSCKSCNRDEVVDQLTHMPLFRLREVLGKLGDNVTDIKLMGMGEPFLHPNFSSICRMAREKFPSAFIISATNCQYKITDNFRDALPHLSMLYLSIDGYGESYERDRPPAKWDKLLHFLSEISRIPRGNCKLAINYTVNPGNVDDIEKTNELIAEYGLDELRLNLVQDWSQDSNDLGGFTIEQLHYLRDNWKHAIKGKSGWEFSDCFWVKSGAYVTADGTVKACCMNTSYSGFGNIFTDTFEKIHNSNNFSDVRKGCATNKPTEHCRNCSYASLNIQLKEIL